VCQPGSEYGQSLLNQAELLRQQALQGGHRYEL
jgi:hypothetical protein